MYQFVHDEKRDGFPHEKLYVIPRPLLAQLRSNPVLHALSVTDAGYFPVARHHLRTRPQGSEEHIFLFCTDGSGFIRMDDRMLVLSSGQAATIPAGVGHSYGASHDDPWTIFWFHVVGDFLPIYLPHHTVGRVVDVSPECRHQTVDLFNRIFASLSRGASEPHLMTAGSAASLILASVYRDAHPALSGAGGPGAREVEHLIHYVQEHLDEPITLEQLSERTYLSVSRINQLFREITGHSPIGFVQHQRVQRACYYLDATDAPVSRVAEIVGFTDQFYFSRVFRKVIGLSPRQYRQR